MNDKNKTKEELLKELKELQKEHNSLKALYSKNIINQKKAKQELIIAGKELVFQKKEKGKRADELILADKELVFQKKEKGKRADELILADKELVFQKKEKGKRADELILANKELVFQKKEKGKRADELILADKELVFLKIEKEKRVKIEESLRETNEHLERSNNELEQFAYVASHDLQEPLRMVSSYTQLLEKRYKDKLDQDANDFIQFAVDGANRMQKLINDLLDYSRITSRGKDFTNLNISQVLGQAISNLQQLIIENTALVTNEELPTLNVDESQLIRVFQNLIENAIKYKKKTELPKIHISCKKINEYYEFAVRDNGIGIDMQFHDRIFIIFQRLHSKEEYSGTGIGLSICKRIVERHGGKIWFVSKINEGTTFYFTLKI